MDFLKEAASKIQGGDAKEPVEHKKDDQHTPIEHKKDGQPTPTTSELLSSAKVVSEAAKAKMNNQEFDQKKAAEAAADIIDGASHYGKLDESQGFGKMLNQAEDYLHKYSTTTTTTTTTSHGGDGQPPTTTTNTTHETTDEGKKEGGYGDIMKMAGDFLKKD